MRARLRSEGGVGVAERARALNQVRGGVDGRERRPIAERSRAVPPLPPPKLPESQVAPGCAAAAAGGGGRGGGGCGGPAARAASPHPFPRWAEAAPGRAAAAAPAAGRRRAA